MIIGHKKQWEYLAKAVKQGKIPQALLFSGEQNLGKKFVALKFAKLLNCENPKNDKPCEVCKNCQSIEKNIYPDLVIVEPMEEKKEIEIGQIRELIARIALRSMSQGFKTIIIDSADTMNQEAQNALLKSLEEPKGKTIFILVAEHQNRLFPTILSRTQILKFYPAQNQEIEKLLRGKISEKEIQEIISFSWGRPGRAINFIANPQEIKIEKQKIEQIQKLIDSDIAFRFQYAKQISEKRDELKQILELWTRYFRTAMIHKSQTPMTNDQPNPNDQTLNYSLSKLKKILDKIEKTQFLLSTTNVNSKLALELLMLEI